MLLSLARLSTLPPSTIVLPGHNYALPAHSTISNERDTNSMMQQAIRFRSRMASADTNYGNGRDDKKEGGKERKGRLLEKSVIEVNDCSSLGKVSSGDHGSFAFSFLPDYLSVARRVFDRHCWCHQTKEEEHEKDTTWKERTASMDSESCNVLSCCGCHPDERVFLEDQRVLFESIGRDREKVSML